MSKIMKTIMTMTAGIHNGDVIHHQDQSIYLINFNVMNIRNINPNIPIPSVFELLSDIFLKFAPT